ncbi:MAG TPA: TonB-dependent receptor [Chitinophagaceae bacterium]|jgi:TonB-linked SusC/RagA family outer membrane protein
MRSILLLRGNVFLAFLFSSFLLLFNQALMAQPAKTVTGKVINAATGEPVAGISVRVKGARQGGTTGATGEFRLNVSSSATTLIISGVGFKEMEVPINEAGSIKLVATDQTLNDVIVVGYGSQKKATLTGAVSVVNAKTMENRGPIANPLAALQGQAPGVIVTRSSAQPGRENWTFQIRGATSTNGQDPLVILDGVALQNNGELNSMNPADIDNISFLKDASAAIYGARAAFGVVLITTKKAKGNKMVIQYDGSVSRKITALLPKLLDDKQWGAGLMQAQINDNYGVTPPNTNVWYQLGLFAANPPDSGYIDVTALPGYAGTANNLYYNGVLLPGFGDVKDFTFFNTDMQRMLWGNANSTQHNLSFSGRTDKSGYRISLGYLNDGSQLRWGLNGNQRYNLRLNHDYTFSNKVKLETNIALEENDIQQPSMLTNGGYSALSNYSQPGIPAFGKTGLPYEWGTVYSAPAQLSLGGDNKEYNTRALINTNFIYNIVNHLTFTGTAGYNAYFQDSRIQQKQIQYTTYSGTPLLTFPTAGTLGGNGTFYNRQNIKDPYYNLIGRLEYHNTFSQVHDVSVMVGSSYERDEYDLFATRTYNLGNDNIPSLGLGVQSGVAGYVTNGETQNHYALGSYFGRATYGYKNKYLLEVLGRYDGTSKFISNDRWKAFYGVSGAWRVTEESFMKQQKFVNDLKIRASFGQTGNQGGIGLYDYLQSLNVNAGQAFLGSSTVASVTTAGALVSLSRTWETVENKNIGIDFSILHSRLSGSFDVFRKENKNMLLGQTYPGVLGATAPALNIGDLKTWGWEGMLSWRDQVGKNLTFTVSATMTDNQNKLVHYGGANVLSAGYNATVEGYSLGSYFGLEYAGRIQDQKTLDNYNGKYAPTGSTNNINLIVPTPLASPAGQMSGLRPGDNMYKDVNGDGKLSIGTSTSNPGDLVYLGRDDPRYSYGINLGLQWKGIDFSTIFQGVGKRTIFRTSNWRVPYGTVFQGQSSAWYGNTWTPTNTGAYFPNLHSNNNSTINTYNYQISSWSVENGAYVRLKNLVIGYTLPQQLMHNIKAIQKLRIYFSGSDLWEITHIHDGWDPEATRTVANNERYPFYRYVTFGVNVTF